MDNVFTLKQIIEKRREHNLETHIAFVDYAKAFDTIQRNRMWRIMDNIGIPSHLIGAIKSLYHDNKIVIKSLNRVSEDIQVNKGLRQGWSLSPTLFNIYIDEIVKRWSEKTCRGIELGQECIINTLLFADDQVILHETEDNLQFSIFQLDKICNEYGLRISTAKSKVMAFKGKDPVRTKIVVRDCILEQVSTFNYLGCSLTYKKDSDINNKISRFQSVCGTIHRSLKGRARKDTELKFFKVMAVPLLMYGSEAWTIGRREESRLQSAEMWFLRAVKGCTRLDRIRNDDIRAELRMQPLNAKIKSYRNRWKEHVERMPARRIPKDALLYRPRGRRDVGRPWRRWVESII